MTREELHRMVWSEPATRIAARLSVSDVYLIRVCGILAVPRPPPGYWRKREVGLDPPVVPLPEAPPGTPREWVKGPRHPAARAVFRSRASDVDIPALIDRAVLHFGAASPDDGGRYLRPRGRDLLDLTTTQPCLGKCVDFAREIFSALSERGHEVRIAPPFEVFLRARIDPREDEAAPAFVPSSRAWRPMRPTVTYIGRTPIGLAVVETCEHLSMHYVGSGRFVSETEYARLSPAERAGHTWKRKMHVPSGRLRLVAYSPVFGIGWSRDWTETVGRPLALRVAGIVAELEAAAQQLADREPAPPPLDADGGG